MAKSHSLPPDILDMFTRAKTSCTTRIAGDEPPELGIARYERDTPALHRNFDFANRQAVGVGSNRFGWGTILFAYRVIARVFVSGS